MVLRYQQDSTYSCSFLGPVTLGSASAAPMAPPSSLLRELLAADGFKNRRKQSDNSSAASRTVSMPLQQRRPTKPARSQSDVLTRSRLRDRNIDAEDGIRDAGEELAAAARRSSASLTSARSYNNKDSSSGAAKGGSAAIPALDESALNALISLAAGAVKLFVKDEAFRASLRGGCTSCIGDSNHRAVLDLRVIVQTVERAAGEGLDPRDLRRASLKLHSMASLDPKEAHAVTAASGVPYERLAACARLYMGVISKLQKKDHSAAVHVLDAFCLAPREARTVLLSALWDRLFRPGLSHLRTWRDRELAAAAAASSDTRAKDVEKMFMDVVDDGTRALACYYRDWLLGRTDEMALPSVPAPPSTAPASMSRFSASTSYAIGSDVAYSSGSPSPAMLVMEEIPRQPEEVTEGKIADAESEFHECDGDEAARSYTPTPPAEEIELIPNMIANETFEPQIEDERSKGSDESTSYLPVSDMSAIDLLTLEFCQGSLRSDTDGNQIPIFSTTPSDFLCPLTRQIFNRPVTIETGQTFERHAIVQWFDRGIKMCPVTGQELESLSIPDTNRVLKRLIDSWKSEHCKNLLTVRNNPAEKLDASVVERVLDPGRCGMSEQIERARHLMAIGGVDFLLRRFQEREEDEHKARAAEHLLLCIRAEGGCRNYVALRLDGSSVIQLVHSDVVSVRSTAVRLLIELLCLRRREMVEMLIRGLCTVSITETMNVLLQHLRSSPVQEQALVAVLLLHLDRALEEPQRNSVYGDEIARILTHSLSCCMSDENVVANTRKALLLLGGHFSFSGDLLAEDRMLRQAGFVDDDSLATPGNSDAAVQKKELEAAENEALLQHATTVLLGGSGRRPFLAALSRCLNSRDADLVAACLTTAAWLSRSLASLDVDATDVQLAAFSALIPRLKQRLGSAHQVRHRVLASVTLHNFSKIPDCRVLLALLVDGLRDHLAELGELTWTAGQLSAELHE